MTPGLRALGLAAMEPELERLAADVRGEGLAGEAAGEMLRRARILAERIYSGTGSPGSEGAGERWGALISAGVDGQEHLLCARLDGETPYSLLATFSGGHLDTLTIATEQGSAVLNRGGDGDLWVDSSGRELRGPGADRMAIGRAERIEAGHRAWLGAHPRGGTWSCTACAGHNAAGAPTCVRCGAPRPAAPDAAPMALRICPRCRRPVRAGARFCHQCGAPQRPPCRSCGAQPPPDSRFCPACGAALSA